MTYANTHIPYNVTGDGVVSLAEFLDKWHSDVHGTTEQGVRLFHNIDLNKNGYLHISEEVSVIFHWFDFDSTCLS